MIDQILLSQADFIEIDILYNGSLSDASNVIIKTLRDPDGTLLGQNLETIEGDTTGRYRYLVSNDKTTKLGVYTAIWQFQINSTVFSHTQYFEVVNAISSGYITPTELRSASTFDDITATEPTDAVLQKFIDKTTQVIDSYLGASALYSQSTDKVRCVYNKTSNCFFMRTKRRPIVSVTSIELVTTSTTPIILDVDLARIKEDTGVIEYFWRGQLPYSICPQPSINVIPLANISYSAGFITVPEDLRHAAVLIAEDLYKENTGNGKNLASISINDYKESYMKRVDDDAKKVIGGGDWNTVKKILNKYRQASESPGIAGTII